MHTLKLHMYLVFDTISGNIPCTCFASSAGEACRQFIKFLPADRFDDYQIYCVGDYELETPPVKKDVDVNHRLSVGKEVTLFMYPEIEWIPIPWSSWRRPESEAELLAPLGLSPGETANIVASKQAQLNHDSSLRA